MGEAGEWGDDGRRGDVEVCPVCWSRAGRARCGGCGWDLTGAEPGSGTRAGERAAAARWDLAAAVLASQAGAQRQSPGARPDRSGVRLLPPLRSVIRQPPAGGGDVPAHVSDSPDRGPAADDGSGAVSVLTALAAGEVDAVHFLGVTPTGLSLEVLVRDTDGALCARQGRGAEVTWQQQAPWLPQSAPERHFLLAGGIGVLPPYGTRDLPRATDAVWEGLVDQAARAVLAGLRADRGAGAAVPLVVAHQAPGWRWPDYVLRVLEQSVPPSARVLLTADDRAPGAVVSAFCRRVPLRHGYALLTRPPDGPAAPGTQPPHVLLFPGGTVLPEDGELTVNVSLLASPGDRASTFALPLVSTRGSSTQDWTVVRTGQTRVGPGERTDVTIALDGPGRLRFAEPGTIMETLVDEDALLGRPASGEDRDTDLELLVEVSGHPPEVTRRLGLLRDVLDRLAAGWPSSSRLRVGVIGYRSHTFGPARLSPGDDPLTVWPPGPVRDARRALEAMRPSPPGHAFASPMEDALARATGPDRWRSDARHLLLILGARPPHPQRQDKDLALPCVYELDWADCLQTLRSGLRAQVIAVRDPLPTTEEWRTLSVLRLRDAWQELGRQHAFRLDAHSADDIATGVRTAAGVRGTVPSLMVDALGVDASSGGRSGAYFGPGDRWESGDRFEDFGDPSGSPRHEDE